MSPGQEREAAGGGEPAELPRARQMLERASWASRAFARYDRASVLRIAEAVTAVAESRAEHYGEWAVRETGFGVAEHKTTKNLLCSRGIFDSYRDSDLVSPRVDQDRKVVAIPRPAGVVFALTPSTNPVSTLYFKVLLALLTRNAVVISPHPFAKQCCSDAAHALGAAAVEAGAPDGIVQVVEEPSIPLIDAMMTDPRTDVILATGGTGVVRSAYSSGNPAIGVGPGNVPVLVDSSADLPRAAERLADSKAFDNSILCTNESVLLVEEAVADRFVSLLGRVGVHLCSPEERDRVRALVFPGGRFDTSLVGLHASVLADKAGLRVAHGTRVLLAPFELPLPEEPLAHEKLLPVLGMARVGSAGRGIDAARAVLRIGGAGHSAAIHSTDADTVLSYGAAVPVLRVVVNVGSSTGSSGFDTSLAPSMTIGTGFAGRSSLGGNLEPGDLVNWTRIAYNSDPSEVMPSFAGMSPWASPEGPVPGYPIGSNGSAAASAPGADPLSRPANRPPAPRAVHGGSDDDVRAALRAVILEELSSIRSS